MYFARIRVHGKLILKSLKTDRVSVAKLRLADLEKAERQKAESQTAGRISFSSTICTPSSMVGPSVVFSTLSASLLALTIRSTGSRSGVSDLFTEPLLSFISTEIPVDAT